MWLASMSHFPSFVSFLSIILVNFFLGSCLAYYFFPNKWTLKLVTPALLEFLVNLHVTCFIWEKFPSELEDNIVILSKKEKSGEY